MKGALLILHRSVAFLTPAAVFGNVVGGLVNGTSMAFAFIAAPIGLLAILTLPTHPDREDRSRSDRQP